MVRAGAVPPAGRLTSMASRSDKTRLRSGAPRRVPPSLALFAALVALALTAGLPAAASAQEAPPAEPAPEATGPGGIPPGFVGISSEDALINSEDYRRRALKGQAELGIETLRVPFRWRYIERARNRLRFALYDGFVLAAAAQGMTVLPVLIEPPIFRTRRPRRGALRGYYPPRRNGDLARLAARLVRRYGPEGTLWAAHPEVAPQPIRAWQVWNEPNIPFYWRLRPNAGEYVDLLVAVAEAILREDPDAEIVTAGLPKSKLGVPVLRYIRQMYAAGGSGSFDTLAVNAYGRRSIDVIRVLAQVRRLVDGLGDGAVSLRATEFAWSDVGPGSAYKAGSAGQASRIRDVVRRLGEAQSWLKLRGFVYYTWRDLPVYPGGKDFWGLHTGLLDIQGRRKPAYDAFADGVRALRSE